MTKNHDVSKLDLDKMNLPQVYEVSAKAGDVLKL